MKEKRRGVSVDLHDVRCAWRLVPPKQRESDVIQVRRAGSDDSHNNKNNNSDRYKAKSTVLTVTRPFAECDLELFFGTFLPGVSREFPGKLPGKIGQQTLPHRIRQTAQAQSCSHSDLRAEMAPLHAPRPRRSAARRWRRRWRGPRRPAPAPARAERPRSGPAVRRVRPDPLYFVFLFLCCFGKLVLFFLCVFSLDSLSVSPIYVF